MTTTPLVREIFHAILRLRRCYSPVVTRGSTTDTYAQGSVRGSIQLYVRRPNMRAVLQAIS